MSTNDATDMEPNNISMDSVVEGTTDRGIPIVKYIEDIGGFAEQFTPPASAELLIGAYTDLFSKFKTYEARLTQKTADFKQKIPEIEESLAVVKKLKTKQDEQEALVTRYSLSDAGVFAKAEIDTDSGLVGLWLGANVMLEYTYEDAIELLVSKEEKAKKEFEEVSTLLLRFDSHCCCLFGK
mmetsp:Transcript_12931/g.23409  ORF Transcript_12931/g.23409 Transcript_12931/m.23409 type:complete len:182 (-) Transcript_12931:309-854(-)